MSRGCTVDTRMQHFFAEQYDKETTSRLKFNADMKAGRTGQSATTKVYATGLPSINPMEFALKKKREEDETMRKIIEEARAKQVKEEMWAPDARTKAKLYEGFSRDGKGRYSYLIDRHHIDPEQKFTFPLLSSWEYGWKVGGDVDAYRRPTFARTAKINESFYTRNGVPTLREPTIVVSTLHD